MQRSAPLATHLGSLKKGYRMPLYIKDDAIDHLARRYQVLTKAPSKTEAVRPPNIGSR